MGELFGWFIVVIVVVAVCGLIVPFYTMCRRRAKCCAKVVLDSLARGISVPEPELSRFEILQQQGVKVAGTILRSGSGLCQDADDEGIEVTVRFYSLTGKEYILKDLHCFHWYADEESRQELQAGADVTIWYDPENPKNLIVRYGKRWRDGAWPCMSFLSGFND